MPVLYIRSTNVSSCAFVAYVCFRPMLNPQRLLHRHRRNCLYRFRTLAGQSGQLRKNGAVGASRSMKGLAHAGVRTVEVRRMRVILERLNDAFAAILCGVMSILTVICKPVAGRICAGGFCNARRCVPQLSIFHRDWSVNIWSSGDPLPWKTAQMSPSQLRRTTATWFSSR